MLPAHVGWPASFEHKSDSLGVVILRGVGELSRLDKVRSACQQSLKQSLVPQFACLRQFQLLRATLQEQVENVVVAKLASDDMRSFVLTQRPNVDGAATPGVLLGEILL